MACNCGNTCCNCDTVTISADTYYPKYVEPKPECKHCMCMTVAINGIPHVACCMCGFRYVTANSNSVNIQWDKVTVNPATWTTFPGINGPPIVYS